MKLVCAWALVVGATGCREDRADRSKFVREDRVAGDLTKTICPTDILGYATVSGSTTGGGTAAPVTVTTLADLTQYAERTEPTNIRVKGMITVPRALQPLQIQVGSNKTIVGVDAQSGLTGGGLRITRSRNVVVENLVIAFPVGTDGISVRDAKHVWIDHCELYSDRDHRPNRYGWLLEVDHGSEFVTVSWSWFHDQVTAVQVGRPGGKASDIPDHLTVTLHHNLFQRTDFGTPLVHAGTVHVFNNHYQDISGYAVASLARARVATEENVFEHVATPLTTEQHRPPRAGGGQLGEIGNVCYPSCTNAIDYWAGEVLTFMPSDSYPYLADSTDSVPVIVGTCAGPGTTLPPNSAPEDHRLVTMSPLVLSGMVDP